MARASRHHSGRRRPESGAAILEFALVAVLVFTVMFGIVQYGYLFWSLSPASATAREAARSLSVGEDWDCVHDRTMDAARSPATGDTDPQVTRAYKSDDGSPELEPRLGSFVTVTVRFKTLNMGLPIFPLPGGGTIEETAQARVENVPSAALPCS